MCGDQNKVLTLKKVQESHTGYSREIRQERGQRGRAPVTNDLEIMVRSLEAIKTQKWVIIISPIQAHI